MSRGRGAPALTVLALGLSACGEGLMSRVERAMDACVALRNPAFVAGNGAAAVERPLPDSILAMADRTADQAGLRYYPGIGQEAATQAVLTCSMELAAQYRHPDTKGWLAPFANHPDVPVAALAKRLLAGQP